MKFSPRMTLGDCSQRTDWVTYCGVLEVCAVNNTSVRASTASRRALPGLKCGTRFSGMATLSPERGFLPMRGGRWLTEKLPKPRISTLCPRTSDSLNASRIVLTANSASRCVSWPNRTANFSTRSLLVIKGGVRTGPAKVISEYNPARPVAQSPFTCQYFPSWHAATHPDWSGQSSHVLTAGSVLPWLLAGRRCLSL